MFISLATLLVGLGSIIISPNTTEHICNKVVGNSLPTSNILTLDLDIFDTEEFYELPGDHQCALSFTDTTNNVTYNEFLILEVQYQYASDLNLNDGFIKYQVYSDYNINYLCACDLYILNEHYSFDFIDCSVGNRLSFSQEFTNLTNNQVEFYVTETYFNFVLYFNYLPYSNYELVTDDENVYQTGFDNGYTSGYDYGFSNGKTTGYNEGFENGKDIGYITGKNDGIREAGTYSFSRFFGAIADVPILYIRNLLGFDVFGISAINILMTMITGCIVLYLLRKVIF